MKITDLTKLIRQGSDLHTCNDSDSEGMFEPDSDQTLHSEKVPRNEAAKVSCQDVDDTPSPVTPMLN